MLEIQSKSISILVFFAIGITSLLSLNQILFPKLLIDLTSVYQSASENTFELGLWSIPFLIFNISFFVLWFFTKFFKISIQKYIKYLLDFDLSKKITILSLIVIFSVYLGLSIWGFNDLVSDSGDYAATLEGVENVELYVEGGHLNYFILRYIFLAVSDEVFGNVNILPFLSSIALLSLTYLFTVKLSGKRISGIVALIILTQSNLFHLFDTTAAYDTFWVSFFLLTLYLIIRKPIMSPVFFISSILTKMVAFLFFPIMIAFILSINKSKKILIVYCFFPLFFIILFFVPGAFSMEQFGTIDISVVGGDTSFEILEIRDTGKGISQTDLNSLFTPFFTGKADLGLDSEKGHGLGLFFVYSMLRDVGGEISVESLEGEGSLFRLKLPKSGE